MPIYLLSFPFLWLYVCCFLHIYYINIPLCTRLFIYRGNKGTILSTMCLILYHKGYSIHVNCNPLLSYPRIIWSGIYCLRSVHICSYVRLSVNFIIACNFGSRKDTAFIFGKRIQLVKKFQVLSALITFWPSLWSCDPGRPRWRPCCFRNTPCSILT